jgi:hypothetical protein
MNHYQTLTSPVANIYAGEVNYDGKNFIFRLNEDATDVTISIEKNNEIVASQSVGALKKGLNKISNPFGKTAFDHYSITASARPVAYPAKISGDEEIFQFYAARGVAVDKTPTSPYFGRVYVADRRSTKSNSKVYVYNPDFTDLTATNLGLATAGYSRPAVGADGTLYLTGYTDGAEAGIFVVDPADLTKCTQFFNGTYDSDGLYKNNGKEIGSSTSGLILPEGSTI